MKLSRRERILLVLLLIAVSLAMYAMFVFQPFTDAFVKKSDALALLEEQRISMMELISDSSLSVNHSEQKAQSQIMYGMFYDKINSYNIDSILSEMLERNNLTIISMQISPYEEVMEEQEQTESTQTTQEAEAEKQSNPRLLKSSVDLGIEGEYDNVLKFIDELHSTSFCLRADELNIQIEMGALTKQGIEIDIIEPTISIAPKLGATKSLTRTSIRIFLYGIEQPKTVESKIQTDQDSTQQ